MSRHWNRKMVHEGAHLFMKQGTHRKYKMVHGISVQIKCFFLRYSARLVDNVLNELSRQDSPVLLDMQDVV